MGVALLVAVRWGYISSRLSWSGGGFIVGVLLDLVILSWWGHHGEADS